MASKLYWIRESAITTRGSKNGRCRNGGVRRRGGLISQRRCAYVGLEASPIYIRTRLPLSARALTSNTTCRPPAEFKLPLPDSPVWDGHCCGLPLSLDVDPGRKTLGGMHIRDAYAHLSNLRPILELRYPAHRLALLVLSSATACPSMPLLPPRWSRLC